MEHITPHTSYSLLPHNTFGIAVRAACFIEYASVEQLHEALDYHRTCCPHLSILHIGGGSNLLFLRDYDGLILHSSIKDVELLKRTDDEVLVRVGAGMNWDKWVAHSLSRGWFGLENLSYIPGEVGASAVQNIGAYGAEVSQFIAQVETVNLKSGAIRVFDNDECDYGYRHSVFKDSLKGEYAVTHVVFRLPLRFVPNLSYKGLSTALEVKLGSSSTLSALEVRDTVIAIRQQKLPNPDVLGNAGSFFMNPVITKSHLLRLCVDYPHIPSYVIDAEHVKIPAAWLIEQCGWKGRRLGNAAVYQNQPLVLVNSGGATGADILALCQRIRQDVSDRFDILLSPEVMMI